ncbi:histidine phosphatase family protein [Kribbella pittospori]|nr:histidine phosphatase family protein [Kribbella pittospori]
MINFILRHGQTDPSVQHMVNGDPTCPVYLNRAGEQACIRVRSSIDARNVGTWVTSEFPRAQQTAQLLIGSSVTSVRVERGLNELDYGTFEGAPFLAYGDWLARHGADKRPKGSAESQREAILRMLEALRTITHYPGDRVVIAHGLLVSVLVWGLSESHESMPLFMPEAPYLKPLEVPDEELVDLLASLISRLTVAAEIGG